MMLKQSLWIIGFFFFGTVSCTSDVSKPTPVYVVEGGEAVLQCGFESSSLEWHVSNGNGWAIIASGATTIDDPRYSVSMNPSTGLYYRLHIKDVVAADLKKHRCKGFDKVFRYFYLELILIVPPSSVSFENVAPSNRLLGTEGQDLTVSCEAVGGEPTPNVVLIIDGKSVANQVQTVQYTLTTINRSYDQKTVTCQASNPAYSQISLTDSAKIYLDLRPLLPTITVNKGGIEGTTPLDVTCTTTGSRPHATLQWTIGNKDVTSDATTRSSHITASDTYTVISDLTYSVGKSDNGKVLTCKAVNVAASSGVQTSVNLNVKYAPTVSVSDVTYDQNKAIRTLPCILVGNPNTYTYYKWQHKSKYGVVIRELDGETNGVLTLPNIPVEDRYQDSGEYVCTAGNGIVGRDGKVKQTGSGNVIINAQPIFTNDNSLTEYGEFGKNVDVNVYVYSIPKYKTKQWYRSNTPVSTSTKYVVSERAAIVNDTFYGKDVQLDGYSVVLTIKNLEEFDFNVSYRLQLSYGASQTEQYTVLLESASPPQTPSNFTLVSSTETSIVVEWIPGYNGGHEQTFNIQYRIINEFTIWMTQEVPQYDKQTYTLSGLKGDTWYELIMFAENKFDKSNVTDIQSISTMSAVGKKVHPQTPTNFSLVSSTETSILVEWTPGYSSDHEQTFYLEYRARKTETWSVKEISHNTKQLTSLTYVLSGLQDSTLYELKMYSVNMFGRSLSTNIDIIQTREKQEKVIQETCSSGFYAVIGGMAGVMTVLISIVIILGTLLFRRNKGWSGGTRNEISNRSDNTCIGEMPSPNRTTNDMYEDIKEDLQRRGGNVSTTTYEMLGMQDIPNTYGDLSSEQGQRQSESTTEQYEMLGEQNKPNVYEQIKNNQESEDREYTNLKI